METSEMYCIASVEGKENQRRNGNRLGVKKTCTIYSNIDIRDKLTHPLTFESFRDLSHACFS